MKLKYGENKKLCHMYYFRLVNEICAIALVQAGAQANQFASAIDRVGNITNFTENRASKSFVFSQDSKETCSLIFVSYKKVYQEKIPFLKTIHMVYFIKGIIGKTNCYWHVRFFFDLYLVSKYKKKQF